MDQPILEKTHVAIEKMLEYDTGIFWTPFKTFSQRGLSTNVLKKLVRKSSFNNRRRKNNSNNSYYFICTVESMPKDKKVDFIAVDEIQMCADRERGHIFTERLLNARGEKLTMFLGSQVMAGIINDLIKNVEF